MELHELLTDFAADDRVVAAVKAMDIGLDERQRPFVQLTASCIATLDNGARVPLVFRIEIGSDTDNDSL